MPEEQNTSITKTNNERKNVVDRKNLAWWQPAISIFLKFSAWIFVPVLLALLVGKWLDNKFKTEPWFFLGTIAFAFTISMFGIIKGVSEEYRKIEKEEKEVKSKK